MYTIEELRTKAQEASLYCDLLNEEILHAQNMWGRNPKTRPWKRRMEAQMMHVERIGEQIERLLHLLADNSPPDHQVPEDVWDIQKHCATTLNGCAVVVREIHDRLKRS